MANQKIEITTDDGRTLTATLRPADLVRAERHYGKNFEALMKDPRSEYMLYLAWLSLTRQGSETRDFETFLDGVDDINDPDAVDEPADDPDAPAPEPFQPVSTTGGDGVPLEASPASSLPSQ